MLPTAAPMRAPYSGSFELDEDDEPAAPALRRTTAASTPAAALPPPSPLHMAALPPDRAAQAARDGPRALIYVKSDRLAQLSAQLPVNSDRSTLVHGLISAYGLLEVRAISRLQGMWRTRQHVWLWCRVCPFSSQDEPAGGITLRWRRAACRVAAPSRATLSALRGGARVA